MQIQQSNIDTMATRFEENMQTKGFVLGVLRSSEMLLKEENDPLMAQRLINDLLDIPALLVRFFHHTPHHTQEKTLRRKF